VYAPYFVGTVHVSDIASMEVVITALGDEPAKPSAGSRARGKRLTRQDSLWNIVGAATATDEGVQDVSTNKHEYLAEAYADLHK
jgi:hypothetical protein